MTIVPVDKLYVDANFRESQLRRVRIGMPVTLTSDLYGGDVVYHGKITGFAGGTGSSMAVIILHAGIIFVVEYKLGARQFDRSSLDQVYGYGLDLKHFHETSHDRPVVPILVATGAMGWLANKFASNPRRQD